VHEASDTVCVLLHRLQLLRVCSFASVCHSLCFIRHMQLGMDAPRHVEINSSLISHVSDVLLQDRTHKHSKLAES